MKNILLEKNKNKGVITMERVLKQGFAKKVAKTKTSKVMHELGQLTDGYFIVLAENNEVGYAGTYSFYNGLYKVGLDYINNKAMEHVFFVTNDKKSTMKIVENAIKGIYKNGKKLSTKGYDILLKKLEDTASFHVTSKNKDSIMNEVLPQSNLMEGYNNRMPIKKEALNDITEVLDFLYNDEGYDDILIDFDDDYEEEKEEKADIVDTVRYWMNDRKIELSLFKLENGDFFDYEDLETKGYYLISYNKKENVINLIISKIPFKKLFKGSYFSY